MSIHYDYGMKVMRKEDSVFFSAIPGSKHKIKHARYNLDGFLGLLKSMRAYGVEEFRFELGTVDKDEINELISRLEKDDR